MLRLIEKLQVSGDCLIFTGCTTHDGYGRFSYRKKTRIVHRVVWVLAGRPLAKHKDLHHTCENKLCCNLAHLRITSHPNHRREFHRQVQCKRGHEMSGYNAMILQSGYRRCRTCHNLRRNFYRNAAAID